MDRIVGISEAARVFGVSVSTLRRWDATDRLRAKQTPGDHQRYNLAKLRPNEFWAVSDSVRRTVACARVSSHEIDAASAANDRIRYRVFGIDAPDASQLYRPENWRRGAPAPP